MHIIDNTPQVLLVTSNLEAAAAVRTLMREFGLTVNHYPDLASAQPKVNRRKYDAAVVDFSDPATARAIMRELYASAANSKAVVLALATGRDQRDAALQSGARFVLDDLDPQRAKRVLKAAYPLILSERRQYFRMPYRTEVVLTDSSGGVTRAQVINISRHGLAIECAQPLKQGTRRCLAFQVSRDHHQMSAAAEVSWARNGRAGLRFIYLPNEHKRLLQEWLDRKLEEMTPVPAAFISPEAFYRLDADVEPENR